MFHGLVGRPPFEGTHALAVLSAIGADEPALPTGAGGAASGVVLGTVTPFLGRDHELAAMAGAFAQVCADRIAQAWLIVGDAGVGKTRLLSEFLRVASGSAARVWVARGDPSKQRAALALLADLLGTAAGVAVGDDAAARARKLDAFAENVRPADRSAVRDALSNVLMVGGGVTAHGSAWAASDRLRRAFVDVVDAASAEHPLPRSVLET